MRQAIILMVEAEPEVCRFTREYLERQGYVVYEAHTLQQAHFIFEEYAPDLVLLNMEMPDADAGDFCQKLRQLSTVPIILLSGQSGPASILKGFSQGGDDYLVKPYDLNVLGARIAALLRRTMGIQDHLIDYPPLHINVMTGEVLLNDTKIQLPQKQFQLLCHLASSAGQRVSSRELYSRIWGDQPGNADNILSVTVSRLRSSLALDQDGVFEIICTPERDYVFRRIRF